MKNLIILIISVFIVGSSAISSGAQSDGPARQKQFNLEKGLAIQGYDPVAYFLSGKAVEGSASHSFTHQQVTYRFASVANLETFRKDPEKYEPAYGGWCAYAMGATGEKVEIDPETFKVKDGRLYLFYHSTFNNTLPKWNKDEANLQKKADQNWHKTVGQ
jgi:YHS domain-containing protein